MTKTLFRLSALLIVMLPAALTAQDPTAIAEGAQVYASYCASCHNARASSERTDLEWIAITLHMRARANFSRRQASTVLAFLQMTNLPETATGMAEAVPDVAPTMLVLPEQLRAELLARATKPTTNQKIRGGIR